MKYHKNLYKTFFSKTHVIDEKWEVCCNILDIFLEETNKQVNEFFNISSPSLEYNFDIDCWNIFSKNNFNIEFLILDKYGILNSIRDGLSKKAYNEIPKDFKDDASTIVFKYNYGVNDSLENNYKKIYTNVIVVGKTYSIIQFIANELGNTFKSIGALLTENEQLKKQIERKDSSELKVFKVAAYLLRCGQIKDNKVYLKKFALVDANNILKTPLKWLPQEIGYKKPSKEILKLVERFEVFEDKLLASKLKGEKPIETNKRIILDDLELKQFFAIDIDDFVEETFKKGPFLIPNIFLP